MIYIYSNNINHSLEHGRIILVAPNEDLGDAAQRLDEEAAIVLGHGRIAVENVVQILEVLQRQTVLRLAPAATEPASTAKHVLVLTNHSIVRRRPL